MPTPLTLDCFLCAGVMATGRNSRNSVEKILIGFFLCGWVFFSCDSEDATDEEICSETAAQVQQELSSIMQNNGNRIIDPQFASMSIQTTSSALSVSTAIAAEVLSAYVNHGYEAADYIGAVSPTGTPWYADQDWSFYAHVVKGEDDKDRSQGMTEKVINDEQMRRDMQAQDNRVTWTSTNTYILDGLVFVQEGEALTIEAGVIVKGRESASGPGASLIIARGGKIMAMGTAAAPIIFTFENDPLDGSIGPTTRGRWGGVVLLGKARLNTATEEKAIEGIPTGEDRSLYGGTEDTDNSGVLTYVSIRHGGTDIGSGNEINGLTLGGVGSGTQIDYVEVVGNKDDGIEWFGGTVAASHLIVAYNADDALDYDQGYRGFNQFVIVHQDPATGAADRGGEHDGGTDPITGMPYAIPLFANLTSVGNASSRAITLRENAGGRFYHSIFTGYSKGVDIEYVSCDGEDSWKRVKEAQLVFIDNVFSSVGSITDIRDMFTITVPGS